MIFDTLEEVCWARRCSTSYLGQQAAAVRVIVQLPFRCAVTAPDRFSPWTKRVIRELSIRLDPSKRSSEPSHLGAELLPTMAPADPPPLRWPVQQAAAAAPSPDRQHQHAVPTHKCLVSHHATSRARGGTEENPDCSVQSSAKHLSADQAEDKSAA